MAGTKREREDSGEDVWLKIAKRSIFPVAKEDKQQATPSVGELRTQSQLRGRGLDELIHYHPQGDYEAHGPKREASRVSYGGWQKEYEELAKRREESTRLTTEFDQAMADIISRKFIAEAANGEVTEQADVRNLAVQPEAILKPQEKRVTEEEAGREKETSDARWLGRLAHKDWLADQECHFCQKKGHLLKDCPDSGRDKCHRCGQVGHFIRDCPRKLDLSDTYACCHCGSLNHKKSKCPQWRKEKAR